MNVLVARDIPMVRHLWTEIRRLRWIINSNCDFWKSYDQRKAQTIAVYPILVSVRVNDNLHQANTCRDFQMITANESIHRKSNSNAINNKFMIANQVLPHTQMPMQTTYDGLLCTLHTIDMYVDCCRAMHAEANYRFNEMPPPYEFKWI